jgi:NTE family protein
MRALVLSGGAVKGAYQVGAIKYLLGEAQYKYDIYCGVSVGALNSAFLGMFKTGEEKEALNKLLELWHSIDTDKIYKRWCPFGRWHALWKPSFYNSDPLQKLVRERLDVGALKKSGKTTCVGAVSLSSGHYRIFNQDYPQFADAVIASSSFPAMLLPIEIEGELWSDGGVKEITPLKAAIDLGATDIDVIITSPNMTTSKFVKDPNSLDVIKRTIELMTDEINQNDIFKALMYNKLVLAGCGGDKKLVNINIIRPDHNLIEDSLNFDPNSIKEMIEKGYNDAKKKFLME